MKLPEARFSSMEHIVAASAESVRPPERLSVAEASQYHIVNNPGSHVGPFDLNKAPYLVEPMNELTSLDLKGLVFVGPARTGKSAMFINWLCHTAICDPADMLVVHMTQSTARDWSQADLDKAVRNSPELRSRMVPGRQNDNVHDKAFLSGMRLLIKWPSITELSGKTIPRQFIMDYDRIPDSIGGEGNAFDLTRKRGQTFKRRAMCAVESSPGREVTNPKWIASSPHEAPPTTGILDLYNRGDRRRWYWQCPQCHEAFEPSFDKLVYPDSRDHMEAAEQVVMCCPHCGYTMEPDQQYELNLGGKWIKDGAIWLPDGSVVPKSGHTIRRSGIASFWMKGPAAAFTTWKELVVKHLDAVEAWEKNADEEALRTTINVDQGEPYIPKALEAGRLPEELAARAQHWGGTRTEPVVPEGVRFLIATVDVQARSFVVQVHGIGVGGDVWLVDMFKIRKSNTRLDDNGEHMILDPAGYIEDWSTITEMVIEKTYPLADDSGRRMQVKLVGCDSGGKAGVTARAYEFWRSLRDDEIGRQHHNRFQLIKGEPSPKAPRYRRDYPDSKRKDRNSGARGDVPVVFLNSNTLKDQISGMLNRSDAAGGRVNFPIWYDESGKQVDISWLYSQLTAEVRSDKGWVSSSGKRNEAWDLLYYCVGLLLDSRIAFETIDWNNPPAWAAEWDVNTLVFEAEDGPRFTETTKKRDLSKLGEILA
ncbi:phage terminase large subunit family protein [Alterisphingorhabdus coralli]|uniref:Terminase gpA endonuclease subunit n=1 Tax=Alterisphingorhabdus coralli TaxID=3071408 RepID=A0AA97I320_9SPHN|nr:terminase gpA endonuclease subunit [Parasphingorhabdus sp. SCSIO 66989]WOE76310.1 terminase gpA endonuclease subunit [Parasphingorhabdus sp. SCSIO 66989]